MAKTLVVVESPAKAKTIKKYLGSDYEVLASKGHIKDLPKKMGIDFANGFKETYEIVVGKEKVVEELKGAASRAKEILLATDPDREGEAIAWHLAEELTGSAKGAKRVEFHEITKTGVKKGVASPRPLNKHLYDAQRARRVLDRIVGYDVSALVWSKLAFGLSAGRVQSVALRLIVDREREIEAFVPEEYWNIGCTLSPLNGGSKRPSFFARLTQKNKEKLEVTDGETAGQVKAHLQGATYKVIKVTKSERKRKAPSPYTTSKLQQDAVNRLGFTAKRTMQIAQGLYEGVDLGKDDGGPVGLITYMRTDSMRTAPEALEALREHVAERYGKEYLPKEPNQFKSKKLAQEAHEAIRPTMLDHPPDAVRKHLKDEQFKLYKLIWDRFVASQMKEAVYDQTGVDIEGANSDVVYGLRVGGRVLKFKGWLEAYGIGDGKLAGEEQDGEAKEGKDGKEAKDAEEATLPELVEGEVLALVDPPGVLAEQKFTQPPPRYSEGSLVRELEERGIGRPSTYAEIISKVQARDYVEKMDGGRQFRPTLLGKFVVDGLVASKLDFMDPAFTSAMEEELDEVEAGREDRTLEHRNRAIVGGERLERAIDQDDGNAEGDEQGRQLLPLDHAIEQVLLHRPAHGEKQRHHHRQGEQREEAVHLRGQPEWVEGPQAPGGVGADHQQLAVRHVDDPHHPEDHGQAQGDDGVNPAGQDTAEDDLREIRQRDRDGEHHPSRVSPREPKGLGPDASRTFHRGARRERRGTHR